MRRLTNWAGNVEFQAGTLHRPASVGELQRLVAGSARIRALGSGHSFSRIADTAGDLVSVARLPPRVEVDRAASIATVSAGMRYSDIAPRLHGAGLALANLASLPHISVAGAVATGTHGSGDANASLAAAVSAIEMVTATGDLVSARRDADPARFPGLVVALGACGIVTGLTLDIVPAFTIRQWVYDDIPLDDVTAHFDEITAAAYSVSLFTDFRDARLYQAWLKQKEPADDPPGCWLGGRLARADRHPLAGFPAQHCTAQRGLPGPWHERLPHFRPDFTPSAGAELQSEFLLGREHARSALAALAAIRTDLASVTLVAEIRTVAADDLWLSPCYQRATVGFHFTWAPDVPAVEPVLTRVEAALAPFAPRPHWGKLSTIAPATVASRYPRLHDFGRLVTELDPDSTFGNEMVDAYLQPGG
jgi:xylitol oxidase